MDYFIVCIIVAIVLVFLLLSMPKKCSCGKCQCSSTEKMSIMDMRRYNLDRDSLGYTKGDYALMALNRAYNGTPIM